MFYKAVLKILQSQWLKTTEILSQFILSEAGVQNLGVGKATLPPTALGENYSLPFPASGRSRSPFS